ncbi:MAG: exonuclease domain-containing protein [Synergistaceae bacterium]|nr:exonuclease domain-containing protein [Synergistaceae bacterium]
MKIDVAKNLPLNDDFSFTAIDFELANNDKRSVCQVGICVVERGRVLKSYEMFVRPPRRANYFLRKPVEIHGITASDVAFAPTFDEVWEKIFADLEGRPLAAHSFRDDAMCFDAVLQNYRIKYNYRKYGYLCTLDLALRSGIHGENNKFSLESLCERYKIPLSPHHAGSDAEGCARLAMKIADELSISSFRELADLSQTPIFPEPELPDILDCAGIERLECYLGRLRHKKQLKLLDCPNPKELGMAKSFIRKHPATILQKDSAMSARRLAQWFAEQKASPIPPKRRRTRHRRKNSPATPKSIGESAKTTPPLR